MSIPSRSTLRRILLVVLALAFACFAGCGKDPTYDGQQRFPISGTVSFDGQPVDGGMISFVPEAGDSNPSGGPILNGKFELPEEQGPNQGRYRVAVVWRKPTGKKRQDSDSGEPIDEVKQIIPPKFNGATTLYATVTDDSEKNVFSFDLKSK